MEFKMSKRERRKTRQEVRKLKSEAGSDDLADRIAAAMLESLEFAYRDEETNAYVRAQDADKDDRMLRALNGNTNAKPSTQT